jgi:zinc/manganese transport system substrate-binding protein/manganese/iron transport system substrate-binding protein
MTRRSRSRLVVACVGVAIIVLACATPGASSTPAGNALRVITSTTVFADMVEQIGGDHVEVSSIVPAGAGPEDYEPKPDDARRLADAQLIVSNGVGLDDFLDDLIEATGTNATRLVLGDGIPAITIDGERNPHFWLDPSLVEGHYIPAIRDALVGLRPADADAILASADEYSAQVHRLDEEAKAKLATIPATHRKLVTFHDAFPYFAMHYDFELVGVILENPGQEPSAAELAALIEKVKAAGVPAVFSEAQFDPKLARTLAEEAGISSVVTTLYTDTLGVAPADTYVGLMAWDVDEVVKALR